MIHESVLEELRLGGAHRPAAITRGVDGADALGQARGEARGLRVTQPSEGGRVELEEQRADHLADAFDLVHLCKEAA